MPSILHYVETYLNYSETFIYNYLTHIKDFDVEIVTRRLTNLDKFPFNGSIHCFDKPKRYSFKWFFTVLSNIMGIRNLYRGFEIFCKDIIKEGRVSLIHAHFGPRGWEILRVKRDCSIPLVTSFYGYDISVLPQQRIWRKRYRQLFKYGDVFIVEGSFIKKRLAMLGCPESKIKIIHIAVDLSRYPYRERGLKAEGEKTIFLFCGRFVEKKGIIYALEAIKRVKQVYPNIEFRLIGDGELRREIEDFIKKNDMGEYVKLLGVLPHPEVIKEMDRADIFIHPSVTASDGDTEGGAPTILIEAQAMGMPVISTYHCDIPEVVVDGKSALLSPEGDVESLYENIKTLLSGDIDWSEMSRAGRIHVEQNYNLVIEVEKLAYLYKALL